MNKKSKNTIEINGRQIGAGNPIYLIAEMSANHHGDLETARQIVHAAKDARADAIKVQTYTADLLTLDCDNQYFTIQDTAWAGQKLYDLYKKASMPWDWHLELKELATSLGLDFFSTPTHPTGVDFFRGFGSSCLQSPFF